MSSRQLVSLFFVPRFILLLCSYDHKKKRFTGAEAEGAEGEPAVVKVNKLLMVTAEDAETEKDKVSSIIAAAA